MSKEQVLKRIERKYEVISQDDNAIVVEGAHDLIDQKVIKTFIFEDNRLVVVDDKF